MRTLHRAVFAKMNAYQRLLYMPDTRETGKKEL